MTGDVGCGGGLKAPAPVEQAAVVWEAMARVDVYLTLLARDESPSVNYWQTCISKNPRELSSRGYLRPQRRETQ